MFAYVYECISNVCIKSTLSKVSMNTVPRIAGKGGHGPQGGAGNQALVAA